MEETVIKKRTYLKIIFLDYTSKKKRERGDKKRREKEYIIRQIVVSIIQIIALSIMYYISANTVAKTEEER